MRLSIGVGNSSLILGTRSLGVWLLTMLLAVAPSLVKHVVEHWIIDIVRQAQMLHSLQRILGIDNPLLTVIIP